MSTILNKLWRTSKLASASLAITAVEVVTIWGAVALLQVVKKPNVPLIVKVTDGAWLLGFGSVVLAIASLVLDREPGVGSAALIFAVLAFFLCGLTKLV